MRTKIWTACITPFLPGGDALDLDGLGRILRAQERVGLGVLLFGSTGEALSLSLEEKRVIIDLATSFSLPIMLGCPSANLREALEWIETTKNLPIDAYLLTTPIYSKPGLHGQTEWFSRLLSVSTKPCVLYNIPSRAGVSLHVGAVERLANNRMFVGIKDSGGSADVCARYKKAIGEKDVFCGDDCMMQEFKAAGATGLISVASNAWPLSVKRYYQDGFNSEELALWNKSMTALSLASNPIPIKALLKQMNVIASNETRLPLSALDMPVAELRRRDLEFGEMVDQ